MAIKPKFTRTSSPELMRLPQDTEARLAIYRQISTFACPQDTSSNNGFMLELKFMVFPLETFATIEETHHNGDEVRALLSMSAADGVYTGYALITYPVLVEESEMALSLYLWPHLLLIAADNYFPKIELRRAASQKFLDLTFVS